MATHVYKCQAALLIIAGLALFSTAHAQSLVSTHSASTIAENEHYASPEEVRQYREAEMTAFTKSIDGDVIPNLASTSDGGDLSCSSEGECVDIELVSVVTSATEGPTYTYQITAKCDNGLSNIWFWLPGVAATSWASTADLEKVELDVNKYGLHFIKFEFSGNINDYEQIEVSYTLPLGYAHSYFILGGAKTGGFSEGFGLDPEDCGPADCVVYSNSDLRDAGTHIVGGDATIVIPSDACDLEISVSSYELPGGEVRPFEDQILFDNVTDTYGPGTHYVSVDLPNCAWQSDVYLGDVVEQLEAGVGHPPHRIIAWDYLEDPNLACVCVGADPPSFDGELIKDGDRRLIEVNAPAGVIEVEFYNTINLTVVGTDGQAGFDRTGNTFTWNFSEGAPPTTVRFELEAENPSDPKVHFFIKITDPCDQVVDVDPVMDLGVTGEVAQDYALHPAYPNPFNPHTQIRFNLPEATNVSLVVYDLMGREVTTLISGMLGDGGHDVTWDGRASTGKEVASGVYLYRLSAGSFSQTRRMTFLK